MKHRFLLIFVFVTVLLAPLTYTLNNAYCLDSTSLTNTIDEPTCQKINTDAKYFLLISALLSGFVLHVLNHFGISKLTFDDVPQKNGPKNFIWFLVTVGVIMLLPICFSVYVYVRECNKYVSNTDYSAMALLGTISLVIARGVSRVAYSKYNKIHRKIAIPPEGSNNG